MADETRPNRKCALCGKETTPYTNYCNWDCQIGLAKKSGGVIYTPNGLPIKCITKDNLMIECEHGDNPDYKFPVEVEYLGDAFETEEDEIALYGKKLENDEARRRCLDETHALIYTDGCIALTMHECDYAMWQLSNGALIGGHHRGKLSGYKEGKFHHGDCKLFEESILKIVAASAPKPSTNE